MVVVGVGVAREVMSSWGGGRGGGPSLTEGIIAGVSSSEKSMRLAWPVG